MTANPNDPPPPVKYDYLGALLSYLVPGLGQLTQGRWAKGLLFFVCLYALFFYGWVLGGKQNVYIPNFHPDERSTGGRVSSDLYTRFQFVGQFPIGMAAWPAVYQYVVSVRGGDQSPDAFMRSPTKRHAADLDDLNKLNDLQRDGDKTWDLGWVYTVIAGVLNVLVIYDALAGAAFREVRGLPSPMPPTGVPAK